VNSRSRWIRAVAVRAGALLACALLVTGLVGSTERVRASDEAVLPTPKEVGDELRTMSHRLEAAEGELALAKVQIERGNAVFKYSSRYQIPADLAASIYDIALSEGIEPDVGFRLVQIESNFKLKALSNAGAVGYTQIQPATAKFYEPGLTEEQLYSSDVNLRLGFRFLKDLLNKYDQDWEIALLAYNRGPARVEAILQRAATRTTVIRMRCCGVPRVK
jgi:soluble lytic murein transglycosylase-like protein